MPAVVIDTNVLVAALLRGGGSAQAVLRACLRGQYQPVLGPALLAEYEDVLGRADLFAGSVPSVDKADIHLIELGVAAQAEAIVTRNLRDVTRGELKFPSLGVLTPEQCREVFSCPR